MMVWWAQCWIVENGGIPDFVQNYLTREEAVAGTDAWVRSHCFPPLSKDSRAITWFYGPQGDTAYLGVRFIASVTRVDLLPEGAP